MAFWPKMDIWLTLKLLKIDTKRLLMGRLVYILGYISLVATHQFLLGNPYFFILVCIFQASLNIILLTLASTTDMASTCQTFSGANKSIISTEATLYSFIASKLKLGEYYSLPRAMNNWGRFQPTMTKVRWEERKSKFSKPVEIETLLRDTYYLFAVS